MGIRIIPRMEIKGPNLVKGIRFDGLRVLGNPRDFAHTYYQDGADELIYIDIVASLYERRILPEVVRDTAQDVFIPLTVGGGIRTLQDIELLLNAGADKVAINTAAVKNPALLSEGAKAFGSQCIVLSIEAKKIGNVYEPYTESGRQPTGLNVLEWARKAVDLGIGEILVTSVDNEGTKCGFDLGLCKLLEGFPVPVIMAGGAGCAEHVLTLLKHCQPDGIACSTLFHYHYLKSLLEKSSTTRERVDFLQVHESNYSMSRSSSNFSPISIQELKDTLANSDYPVRRSA